jgi:hypothetical protein
LSLDHQSALLKSVILEWAEKQLPKVKFRVPRKPQFLQYIHSHTYWIWTVLRLCNKCHRVKDITAIVYKASSLSGGYLET